jgi:hypothetical protein
MEAGDTITQRIYVNGLMEIPLLSQQPQQCLPMKTTNLELRWKVPYMARGNEYFSFWQDYLSSPRNLLLIVGRGFDPRMNSALESIIQMGGEGLRDSLLIEFNEGYRTPSAQQ